MSVLAMNEQMQGGLARLLTIDGDEGTITRQAQRDNGRGVQVATGAETTHLILCRVSYEAGGVWRDGVWAGGNRLEMTPCLFAVADADIREGDTLDWRGKRYKVDEVSQPHLGGACVATQARLTEIKA
jgi:hypothetical protein